MPAPKMRGNVVPMIAQLLVLMLTAAATAAAASLTDPCTVEGRAACDGEDPLVKGVSDTCFFEAVVHVASNFDGCGLCAPPIQGPADVCPVCKQAMLAAFNVCADGGALTAVLDARQDVDAAMPPFSDGLPGLPRTADAQREHRQRQRRGYNYDAYDDAAAGGYGARRDRRAGATTIEETAEWKACINDPISCTILQVTCCGTIPLPLLLVSTCDVSQDVQHVRAAPVLAKRLTKATAWRGMHTLVPFGGSFAGT